jgi:uncharacterized damage-inducible protein DinB
MDEKELNELRYPIGRFSAPKEISPEQIKNYIKTIEETPAKYRNAVQDLKEEQLDTPYRPDGWTIRQVVHHVPDSHLNSYVRFKLGLTENKPTIKPYDEAKWAELDDSKDTPVEVSLTLLESLHKRWVTLLRSMTEKDFQKTIIHPERGEMRLDKLLALYDWHCKHHLTHIVNLRKRMGW